MIRQYYSFLPCTWKIVLWQSKQYENIVFRDTKFNKFDQFVSWLHGTDETELNFSGPQARKGLYPHIRV